MLTYLSELTYLFGPFNLFRYITFRAGGATATALFFVFFFGPAIISSLRLKQGKGQPIRLDGPESHLLTKKGTPTMGGLMILSGVIVSTILWANPRSAYVWIVMFVTLGFGAIGFYDDYLKVTRQTHAGFSGRARLVIEATIAVVACYLMMCASLTPPLSSFADIGPALTIPFRADAPAAKLVIPFITGFARDIGFFFLVFGSFIIVAAGNAVNLTDGLDGLAIVPSMIAAGTFALIAYLAGNSIFAAYLGINHVSGAGELAVVCGALIGAGLGFLWFNAPPAQIFMGDTGSLALGGVLAGLAVTTKTQLLLVILGGLFVIIALSVIIQVGSFKMTGKRVFRMAPLQHHFELLGWAETTIVIRFWLICGLFIALGLGIFYVEWLPG
jgi:phospho-N-acetylmuramoyl-pentapeptide-transferase